MFAIPPGVRDIIWRRVSFLNACDRVASHLKSRPHAVWKGTSLEGTQVVIRIPGEKVMELAQRDSSWYDTFVVKYLNHCTCSLWVLDDRVRLRFHLTNSGWYGSHERDLWHKAFGPGH